MVEATITSRLAAMAMLRSLRLCAVPHPSAQQSSVQTAGDAMALSTPPLLNLPSASAVSPLERPPSNLLSVSGLAPHQLPIKKRPLEGKYLASQPASQARLCGDEFGEQPPAPKRRVPERVSSLGHPSTPDQWPPKAPKVRNCEAMSVPEQPPQPQPRERQQAHQLQAASASMPPHPAIDSAVTAAFILQLISQEPVSERPRTPQVREHPPSPNQLQMTGGAWKKHSRKHCRTQHCTHLQSSCTWQIVCHASNVSSCCSARSNTCSFSVPLSPHSAVQQQPQLLKHTSLQATLRHAPENLSTYVASPVFHAPGGWIWPFGRVPPFFVGPPPPPTPQSSLLDMERAQATHPLPLQLASPAEVVLRQGIDTLSLQQQAPELEWVRAHPDAAHPGFVNPLTTYNVQHKLETPIVTTAVRNSTATTVIEDWAEGMEFARACESTERQSENRSGDDTIVLGVVNISEISERMVGPAQAPAEVPQASPLQVGDGRELCTAPARWTATVWCLYSTLSCRG